MKVTVPIPEKRVSKTRHNRRLTAATVNAERQWLDMQSPPEGHVREGHFVTDSLVCPNPRAERKHHQGALLTATFRTATAETRGLRGRRGDSQVTLGAALITGSTLVS